MKNEIGAARMVFFFILRLPCWILVIMFPSVAQLTFSILCSVFVSSMCFKFPVAEQNSFFFFTFFQLLSFFFFFYRWFFPRFCSSSVTRVGSFQTKLGCIWAVFLPLMLVLLFDISFPFVAIAWCKSSLGQDHLLLWGWCNTGGVNISHKTEVWFSYFQIAPIHLIMCMSWLDWSDSCLNLMHAHPPMFSLHTSGSRVKT